MMQDLISAPFPLLFKGELYVDRERFIRAIVERRSQQQPEGATQPQEQQQQQNQQRQAADARQEHADWAKWSVDVGRKFLNSELVLARGPPQPKSIDEELRDMLLDSHALAEFRQWVLKRRRAERQEQRERDRGVVLRVNSGSHITFD